MPSLQLRPLFIRPWLPFPGSLVCRYSEGGNARVEIIDKRSRSDSAEVHSLHSTNRYSFFLQMRGTQKNSRGGLLKDKHPGAVAIDSSKCRIKHARVDRLGRFWRWYAQAVVFFVICLFILTLKPNWLSFFCSNRVLASPPALEVGNSIGILLDPLSSRPVTSSALIELQDGRSQDAKLKSVLEDIHRDHSNHSNLHPGMDIALNDRGHANPLGLSNRLKIFVYELPPKFNEAWLKDARCGSHLFAAEVAIHQRLLRSPTRTLQPLDADFFFVPVYVTCKFSATTGFPSLGHATSLLKSAVQLISREMPYWNRSGGKDHIFVATHDYGACFHTMEDVAVAAGIPDFLQRSILLQTFGRVDNHPCQAADHIQIPPFVPPSSLKLSGLAQKQHRDIWAFFRGKIELRPKNVSGRIYSRGVRTSIWRKFSHNRRFLVKRTRSANYQSEIRRAVFCLCPLGWAPWSPRIVESVILGCVPVIIADKISLPYAHTINWTQISLTVPEKDVIKLDKILSKVSRTNLSTIQRNLWKKENRRALLYTEPLIKGDATWQILELLSRKLGKPSNTLIMPLTGTSNHTA